MIFILKLTVTVIAMAYMLRQVRKPTKWVGRLIVSIMNRSHSGMTDWALEKCTIETHFTILDVGCGGGRTIQKLARLASAGKVYGIDYSEGSVATSKATNALAIEAGKVEIWHGSVSQLPYDESMFDVVTAFETIYYWPDLIKDMQQVLHVLKPGGTAAVVVESHKKSRFDTLERPVMRLMKTAYLDSEEYQALFADAGFTDIQVFEEKSHGWLCVTGKKSMQS